MSSIDLLYAATVLVLAYFVRGISGFGSGLIAVPLLALRFPLTEVVPFMLVADFAASALIGGITFKRVDWVEIRRLLPATLVGVALGTTLLVSMPASTLLTILAGFVLIFSLRALFTRDRPFQPVASGWAYPAALGGGAVSGLFGTGGPPYVIYLSHRIENKASLRATLSVLFFLEGLIRIVTFLTAGLMRESSVWMHSLMAAPLIVAALYAGSHIHARLSNRQMSRLIGALLLVSGISLLFKAWH